MNDIGEIFASFLWLTLLICIVVVTVIFTGFIIPIILVAGSIWFVVYKHYHSPAYLERVSREHTLELYNSAIEKFGNVPDKEEFGKQVYHRMPKHLPDDLENELLAIALDLYDIEHFNILPPPPTICNTMEGAKYRDFLSEQLAKDSAYSAKAAIDCIIESITKFGMRLPEFTSGDEIATIPLGEMVENRGELIETLVLPYFKAEVVQFGLFKLIREQLQNNMHDVSGVSYFDRDSPDLIMPADYDGDDVVEIYLRHTPFEELFDYQVPFSIPNKVRFEHHWVLAGTGHGKTQTLQHLLLKDFERVANDEASVVVIDSQNQLINAITHLELFSEGQPLHNKLLWIDPGDVEYPLSLNLFDAKLERIEKYSMRDRERLLNNLVELYEFVFRSLLSSEMTDRQSTLFQFLTRLMLQIPNSNVHTLVDFLGQNSLVGYEQDIAKLDNTARGFFETDYKAGSYKDTQLQVRNRLYSILRTAAFDRMFSAKTNKVDLFKELNTSKVILINTDKDLLKENGSSFFGRFFIAMLLQAIEERSQHPNPLPTFLYIDEVEDYFDEQFPKMLSTVRKHNIGVVLAHQFLDQASEYKIAPSLISNTSIKFVGGVSPRDASALAPAMNTSTEFIRSQPVGAFAAYIKGYTESAVSLKVPFLQMEKSPKLSNDQRDVLRNMMREKYSTSYTEEHIEAPVEEKVLTKPVDTLEKEDIEPSDEL